MTTRWPTPAIRYDETYEPTPFTRYRPTMPPAISHTFSWFGSVLSTIGLMSNARPVFPIATTAQVMRERYGLAYSLSRRSEVCSVTELTWHSRRDVSGATPRPS